MSVEAMYADIILDHYKAKHHSGLREPYQAQVTHVNPTCGDEVQLRVALEGDRVADVSYSGIGCSISQASTSVMTDLVIGRTVTEALALHEAVSYTHLDVYKRQILQSGPSTANELARRLGLTPAAVRRHLTVLKMCIRDRRRCL